MSLKTGSVGPVGTLRAMALLLRAFPVLLDDFRAFFPPHQVTMACLLALTDNLLL